MIRAIQRWLFPETMALREGAVRDAHLIRQLRQELSDARLNAFVAEVQHQRMARFLNGQVIALRARNDQLEALHRDKGNKP